MYRSPARAPASPTVSRSRTSSASPPPTALVSGDLRLAIDSNVHFSSPSPLPDLYSFLLLLLSHSCSLILAICCVTSSLVPRSLARPLVCPSIESSLFSPSFRGSGMGERVSLHVLARQLMTMRASSAVAVLCLPVQTRGRRVSCTEQQMGSDLGGKRRGNPG